MKRTTPSSLRYGKKVPMGLVLLASLLTLALLAPRIGARDEEATGCPHQAQASHDGCTYKTHGEGSRCPPMDAMKGSGCPYLAEAKGCLHALRYSLELDEGQKARLREIQGKFMQESDDLKKRIKETGSALDLMFRDPEVSAEEISAKWKTLAGLKEKLEQMALDHRLKIREGLTEEQLRQVPKGCWHGVLAYGHGDVWSSHRGCKCPHKADSSGVSS